jgi:hypothetical protein
MAQIGEAESKKRVRPEEQCFGCAKWKPIYNHVDGDKSKPLCGACSMRLHRLSPGAVQTKVSKVGMQAIGALDLLIGLPGVEEGQRQVLQQMQDTLKLMVRRWLGEISAGEVIPATAPVAQPPASNLAAATGSTVNTSADSDASGLNAEGRTGVSAPKPSPEEPKEVRAIETEPKPKTKRKARSKPKVQESRENITETTPNGYFARLNRKPKGATEEAQPWEIYKNVNGAKPALCCRERNRQDAEAQTWKLDRRGEDHIASLPTYDAAEAAAV